MITLLDKPAASAYLPAFGSFLKGRPAAEHWLRRVREQALAHFEDLGFPTTEDEDWRFTNVDAIAKTAFARPTDLRTRLFPARLQPFAFPGLPKAQLVFVDGRYAPGLSDLSDLPAGVVVLSLAEALRTRRDLVEPHLARYAATAADAFNALNIQGFQNPNITSGEIAYQPNGLSTSYWTPRQLQFTLRLQF